MLPKMEDADGLSGKVKAKGTEMTGCESETT